MEITLLLLLAAALWFWWDGVGAKEAARRTGHARCMTYDLQFLDDSVAVVKIRLRRNPAGQMQLYRVFHFEFSSDGVLRHHGQIEMLGRRVLQIQMDAYPGPSGTDEVTWH